MNFRVNGKDTVQFITESQRRIQSISFSTKFLILSFFLGTNYRNWKFLMNKEERTVKKQMGQFYSALKQVIAKRIAEIPNAIYPHTNFLEMLICKYREGVFQKDEIMAQFITFFIAGTESTGILAGMCLYALAIHSECERRVCEEIERENQSEQ